MFILSFSLLLIALLIFRTNPPPPPPPPPPTRHVSFSDSPLDPFPTPRRPTTSDTIHPLKGHTRVPSAPSAPASPRTKFVNPFGKRSRSRTLSSPRYLKSPDTPSSPSPQSTARRTLANKFKNIFKPTPSQSNPIIQSNPFVSTTDTGFRRKPVPRTQPYGPPWNAPMPVPDSSLSQRSLPNSPTSRKSRRPSTYQNSTPPRASTLPPHVSPLAFISELDEKLSLLQQQRIKDIIPSPHA